MKKLLFILLCLPMIGFGQSADDYLVKGQDALDKEVKVENFTKCLELNPNHIECLINRARAYIETYSGTKSLEDLNKVIRLKPDYSEAYIVRAVLYWQLRKNPSKAINDLNKIININESDDWVSKAYNLRGKIKMQENMGIYSACSDFKKSCDLGYKGSCKLFYTKCE